MGLENIPLWLDRYRPKKRWVFAGSLPTGVTFSRASGGTYFDATGVLRTAANNEPRFGYDPVTLQLNGLLIEQQRTNSVRNSTMQGASVPSTLPSGWGGGGIGGLTRNITGVGTEYGLPYIDIQFIGTTTTGGPAYLSFTPSSAIPAGVGQTWTASYYARIVGGSKAYINEIHCAIDEASSGVGYLTSGSVTTLSLMDSTLRRFSYTRTLTNGSTAYTYPVLKMNYSVGAVIDITIRLYAPQMEQGSTATSFIPTSTSPVTRAAETVTDVVGSEFNPSQGTFVATAMVPYSVPANRSYLVGVSDGTGNNVIANLIETNGKPLGGNVIAGTVSISGGALDGVQPYVPFTNIVSYKAGANIVSSGGATDTAGAFGPTGVPSGLNRYDFGCGTIANRNLNGWLQSVEYYPFAFNSVKANKESA